MTTANVAKSTAGSPIRTITKTMREVGIDNVLFETDFPHPTSLYPIDNLEERLADLTQEERAKVLSLNAAKLYNIVLPE